MYYIYGYLKADGTVSHDSLLLVEHLHYNNRWQVINGGYLVEPVDGNPELLTLTQRDRIEGEPSPVSRRLMEWGPASRPLCNQLQKRFKQWGYNEVLTVAQELLESNGFRTWEEQLTDDAVDRNPQAQDWNPDAVVWLQ